MKKYFPSILTAALCALSLFAAEETRTIRLIQDDAQPKMATKVYQLRHLKASDIATYVTAAARRYFYPSNVRSLNFSAAKQQCLIVTTAEKFIPYVDQIVATLDRGRTVNRFNSKVAGVGYKWKVYYPKYRPVSELWYSADVMLSGTGNVYYDNGTLWLKDDQDDIDYALDWIKYFDRPVPQVNVKFRYYTVRESTLRDLGIDYLAWKNGPGMNLIDVAYKSGRLAWDKVLMDAFGAMNWSYGGFTTAPAFDFSFVRLLQQSGDAKIVATANLNIISGQEEDAVISLEPQYSNIIKDESDHKTSVVAGNIPDLKVIIFSNDINPARGTGELLKHLERVYVKPTICFHTTPQDEKDPNFKEYGWIPATKSVYDRNKGAFIFAYEIEANENVESNNYGTQIGTKIIQNSTFKTVDLGKEQLLSKGVRETEVEQTVGIPFLCQIPILKYIFGTTTTLKEKVYTFVTVEANLVYPENIKSARK